MRRLFTAGKNQSSAQNPQNSSTSTGAVSASTTASMMGTPTGTLTFADCAGEINGCETNQIPGMKDRYQAVITPCTLYQPDARREEYGLQLDSMANRACCLLYVVEKIATTSQRSSTIAMDNTSFIIHPPCGLLSIARTPQSVLSVMRGSQTWQLEPEWTPLSNKSPAETLEPAYLRSYLSKEPLCPGFDPSTYASLPSRLSLQRSANLRSSGQQGAELELDQTRDSPERSREFQQYAPSPSTTFLAPSVPQPASSYDIRLLIDRLSSLDGSINSMQQRLDEHGRKAEQAETTLQNQITTMLDRRDKELMTAMEEKIQAAVDSVRDAAGGGGVGEAILQQVGQLGQEAREAHLELHKDLEDQSVKAKAAEKRFLGGLKELKDEMNGSRTILDRLCSEVSQQSKMIGLIVEQHRASMTQLSTLQICMNSCLAERRDISPSHLEFGAVRMLSPPADAVSCDAVRSQETTTSFTSPTCTDILDRLIDTDQTQHESRGNEQPPERPDLMLTPAASMMSNEPEEAAGVPEEPTGTEKLTKVSVTYSIQDEGSVTDAIQLAQVMPSPAKHSKRPNRRLHPRQAGLELTAQKHESTTLASVKKIKLSQKPRAPVTSGRTRLQDRNQQNQLDSGDKQLTSLLSGPVHLTRAKRSKLLSERGVAVRCVVGAHRRLSWRKPILGGSGQSRSLRSFQLRSPAVWGLYSYQDFQRNSDSRIELLLWKLVVLAGAELKTLYNARAERADFGEGRCGYGEKGRKNGKSKLHLDILAGFRRLLS
ncbi:hypothetical protein EC968_007050 [Mortierella alpina]|nr:hypothetical protein EC968_007050 [Mortierella alpina]